MSEALRLPGVCPACRRDLYFVVRYRVRSVWRDSTGKPHQCGSERPICGAWMPYAKELCARRPGHRPDGPGRPGHRTRYALDNNYRANVGRDRLYA